MADVMRPLDSVRLAQISEAWQHGSVLVTGVAQSGKLTALRTAASTMTEETRPALEFAASPYTTIEDLVGRYQTGPDKSARRFVPGLLTEAMNEGRRLIIANVDQMTGLARDAVLAALRRTALPPLRDGSHVTTVMRQGFRLAATAEHNDFELSDAFDHAVSLD